ncbi:MAG: amidohydrolase [Putridiphycobacter sp.]|nr:amidohydrolase [Putridiphycobacter sp.]
MKIFKTIVLYSFLTTLLVSCYQGDQADLIVHNARIYTCDQNFSIVEAMAIRDGKIIQVGPEREILNGFKCDHIIDAELRPIYPGFYDAHCHFWGYANTFNTVNLNGCQSFEEVLSRVTEFYNNNQTEWITGRGWDQNLWTGQSFPNNDSLTAMFPNTPVLLRRIDGHAAIANAKALELAGITAETEIEGGQIEVANGLPTGILIDNAVDLVIDQIPELGQAKKLDLLQKAEQKLFEQGLTTINDAGITGLQREDFIKWYTTKQLRIKNYSMLFPEDDNLDYVRENGEFDSSGLHINSFKLIADGALGSRGACMIAPYSDSVKHFGTILRSAEKIENIAKFASNVDFQLNTHCIGDSANRLLLNIYQTVIGQTPDHRWKIEHAQIMHPDDFKFYEYLGVIPSVQPTHCTSDMAWVEDRIGKARAVHAYAYQTLLAKAGIIALGTDFPIENISVLETFYAAITRKKKEDHAGDAFHPEEQLSRQDAMLGITRWAAFSNFEDKTRGSLEAGKDADFVILTKDIMTIPEAEILKTFVFKTYLDGEMVYSAE